MTKRRSRELGAGTGEQLPKLADLHHASDGRFVPSSGLLVPRLALLAVAFDYA